MPSGRDGLLPVASVRQVYERNSSRLFDFIAIAMGAVLKFIYDTIAFQNCGIAIIFFTAGIKALLLPWIAGNIYQIVQQMCMKDSQVKDVPKKRKPKRLRRIVQGAYDIKEDCLGEGAGMSDSIITKMALANSLKELMTKKAFSKICVRDIVNNCGLTRQTFYYHFKDKYDLMNWIYYTETAGFMSSYNNMEHWMDGLKDLCNYMRKNKTFYINALNTTGQNSFQEYLYGYIRDISVSVIESIKTTEFEEEKWGFIAEFTATAFVALIVRWANDGMQDDPGEYIMKMRSLFDGSILYELENHSKKSSENLI